ncbi:MAG: hypothetical protein ACXABY_00805 [Candidatus Thorarchaeota archaeon]|jgi:hypothetical protein
MWNIADAVGGTYAFMSLIIALIVLLALWNEIRISRARKKMRKCKDKCEVCLGEKGGVPGNENVIDGKVLCDYCSVDPLFGNRSEQ